MKQLRLKESCTQYTTTRNRYGDLVLTSVGTILCLYRDVSELTRNQREESNIQGIFWFSGSATVAKGDVIGYGGLLYRLERITNAKTLLTYDSVHFIKATASLYRSIS